MNGMDMMVNAVLKATGFDRAQFDEGVKTAKSKAANFEARFDAMETNMAAIKGMVQAIAENLYPPKQIQRAADAQESDHAD